MAYEQQGYVNPEYDNRITCKCSNPECTNTFKRTPSHIKGIKHITCSNDCRFIVAALVAKGVDLADSPQVEKLLRGRKAGQKNSKRNWVDVDYICEWHGCRKKFTRNVASQTTHKRYCCKNCANYASKWLSTGRMILPREERMAITAEKHKAKVMIPKPSDRPKAVIATRPKKNAPPNPNKLSQQKPIPTKVVNKDDYKTVRLSPKMEVRIRKDSTATLAELRAKYGVKTA